MNLLTAGRLVVAASTAFALLGAAAGLAADYKLDGTYGWLAVGEVTPIEKGHAVFTGQFSGVYTDRDSTSPLNATSWQCPAYEDFGVAAGGYCIIADNAGDSLVAKWQNDGKVPVSSGSFSFTGGTGKFADAGGSGKFSAVFVGAPHTDGKQAGYATFDGVLTLAGN